MKKKREFFLHIFVIASDITEAEQIARREAKNRSMRFYEFDHSEFMNELQYCNVYRVKKLPSLKNLINHFSNPVIERIDQCGTKFE